MSASWKADCEAPTERRLSPATNTFGGSTFGQPAQQNTGGGLFGATSNAFGAKPATTGFGAPTATGGGLFGAKPAGFGVMGAANNGGIAQGANAGGPIPPPVTQGTSAPAYEQTYDKEPGNALKEGKEQWGLYVGITTMPQYRGTSQEELRLQDYQQNRKTAPANTGFGATTGGGLFGQQQTQPQQPSTGLFGQPQSSGFGAATGTTGGGLFGASTSTFGQPSTNTATSGFGSTPASGGLFGQSQPQQPSGGLFGQQQQTQQPATTGGLFGGATSTFGQPAQQPASTGFGFGAQNQAQQAPKPAFGFGSGQTSTFGQAAPTSTQSTSTFGGFGQPQQQQQQAQQPATSGFTFGASSTTPAAGTQQTGGGLFGGGNTTQTAGATGGLFGGQNNAPKPGGLFGTPATTNSTGGGLFGGSSGGFGATQQQQQQQPTTSLFGGNNTANQTATGTGTSLFGQPAQQNTGSTFGGFGATQNKPAGGGLFGASTQPNGQQPQQQQQQQQPGGTGTFGGFGFGSTNTSQPAAGGGLFGASTQASQPASGGLFGGLNKTNPAPSGGGLFGQQSTGGGLFGSTNQNQSNSGGLFGSTLGQSQAQNVPNAASITQSVSSNPYGSNDLLSSASSFQPIKTTLPPVAPLPPLSSSMKAVPSPLRTNNVRLRGFASPSTPQLGSSGNRPGAGLFDSISPSTIPKNAFTPRRSVKKLVIEKKTTPALLQSTLSRSRTPLNPEAEREGTVTPDRQETPVKKSTAATKRGLDSHPREIDLDKLEDGEYYTLPEMSVLCNASHDELAAVKEFVVGRKGFGELRYLEPVDLNTVNELKEIAGTIVVFSPQECEVYPEGTEGQEEGHGLNFPARITLENCWPIDKSTRKPIKDANHPKMKATERKCRNQEGTSFVSFSPETGVWVFEVPHFTKYGLLDDDSDDEMDEASERTQTPPPSSPASSSPTDAISETAGMEDDDEQDEDDDEDVGDGPVPWSAQEDMDRLNAMQAALFGEKPAKSVTPPPFFDEAEEGSASDLSQDQPVLGETSLDALDQVPLAKSVTLGREGAKTDLGLAMGRSWRAGWSDNGVVVPRGTAITIRDAFPTHDSSIARRMIDVEVQHSTRNNDGRWQRQNRLDMRKFASLFGSDSSFEACVWRLAAALFDPIDSPLSHVKRKLAVSRWLSEVVSPDVEHELLSTPAGPATVYKLLSGNQIERAVNAAIDAGDLRLATLVSQVGHDLRQEMQAQLDDWRESRADALMSDDYRRLYALMAGEVDGTGLEWLRVFGLHLWYASDAEDPVEVAVKSFASSDAVPTSDARWTMLKIFALGDSIDSLADPKAYEMDSYARRLQWHLLQGLEGVDDRLTKEYAEELEAGGLIEQAAFVLLHLSSAESRRAGVKALLARHTVEIGFGVPVEWIQEAKVRWDATLADYLADISAGGPSAQRRRLLCRVHVLHRRRTMGAVAPHRRHASRLRSHSQPRHGVHQATLRDARRQAHRSMGRGGRNVSRVCPTLLATAHTCSYRCSGSSLDRGRCRGYPTSAPIAFGTIRCFPRTNHGQHSVADCRQPCTFPAIKVGD